MTFAEEFVPIENEEELGEDSGYPEAFGITFTPMVGGIAIGVLGILVAAYLGFTQLGAAWSSLSETKENIKTTEREIETKKKELENAPELDLQLQDAQRRKQRVIALLSSEQSLDTLLLDLNRFSESRQAQLTSYKPDNGIQTVEDSSLGTALNGKMKRQSIDVEFEGTFDQTQSLIRNIERLQSSLLLVKDFQSEVFEEQVLILEQNTIVPSGQPRLKTKFRLDAILPIEQDIEEEEETDTKEKDK